MSEGRDKQLDALYQHFLGGKDKILFCEIASKWLKIKMEHPKLRESTKGSYTEAVSIYLLPEFGDLFVHEITNEIWTSFVLKHLKIGKKKSFFNQRKVLNSILLMAVQNGFLAKKPFLEVFQTNHDVGRVLEREEIIRIIWKSKHKFRVIFYAFWKMGCRPGEILKWKWENIKWKTPSDAVINIPREISKTDRFRTIPLNTKLARLLYSRYNKGNGSPFVFPRKGHPHLWQRSYDTSWKKACKLAGVRNAVVYDFRRSFVTERAIEGIDLMSLAKFLDTSVDQIQYTYYKATMEKLRGIAK